MKSLFLKNIYNKNEREYIRLNKRIVTFLVCILISTFFWLLLSFSKEYTTTIRFPITYVNLPKDKVIANDLPSFVDIDIKATGFRLLLYKFTKKRETILIDVRDLKLSDSDNHYYLLTNTKIERITSQLKNEIKIVKINPDTLFLNLNKKSSKRVPVKANLAITYNNQYQQTDTIKIIPAFVDVSGAADLVEKVGYLETVPVTLQNVTAPLTLKLNILKTASLKLLALSPETVQAVVNVTKYTEGNLELPIEVQNLPLGYSIKMFPDKISVKYNVAFEDYEKINPAQFRAIVDYSKIESGNNKLKVQLVKYPSAVRSIKINPEKVEFIIRK